MERKDTIDYIQAELNVITSRLRKYIEWGYASCLSPLVDVMCEYENKLKALKVEEIKSASKNESENL